MSKLIRISLFFLLVIALFGTLMRATFLFPVSFNYTHFLHAHSHVGFQGWIYTALFLLLTQLFLSPNQIEKGKYQLQFFITLVMIVGIIVSFALQGYGLYSIVFSTLFQLMNYWFIFRFLKDMKTNNKERTQGVSKHFIRTGLILGLISTVGPYLVGILSANKMQYSDYYDASIYFFLHFQYSGWFLFALIGVLVRFFENKNLISNTKSSFTFFYLLIFLVFLVFCLSLLGLKFKELAYPFALFAGFIHVVALFYLFRSVKGNVIKKLAGLNNLAYYALLAASISFILKIAAQCIALLPHFEVIAFTNRSIIMAYMHLNLIGILTFGILGILFHIKWLEDNLFTRIGFLFLLFGFVVTELLLVLQMFWFNYYPVLLFIFSFCMVLGIFLILINSSKTEINMKSKNYVSNQNFNS